MPKSKSTWKENLEKKLKAKEEAQPLFWFYIWMGIGVAFFFVGFLVGSVIEHNIAVADIQNVFDFLPPECKGMSGLDEQVQEVIKKWNVTNITGLY